MKFAAIADWADSGEFPVALMCDWLQVSRSGYYAWRGATASARSRQDDELLRLIQAIHTHARGNPGVRRVRAGLAALGHHVSGKRVWRLMRCAGLEGRHPKAYKRTTVPGDHPVPAPDRIGRDFSAPAPNHKWCGDITYVKTWNGWAYTATVIDLYSRKVIGYATADHMRTSLVTDVPRPSGSAPTGRRCCHFRRWRRSRGGGPRCGWPGTTTCGLTRTITRSIRG